MYACLANPEDFDGAIITAVNHSGISAAVGAIVGAIMGARLGEDALPEFYLESLECADVLRTLAADMAASDSPSTPDPLGSNSYLFLFIYLFGCFI